MAQYKDITFSDDDLLDATKVQQIATNERYLYDNMPSINYRSYRDASTHSKGMKIACGIVQIPPHHNRRIARDVSFGTGYFSPSCYPVVVVSHSGTGHTTEHINSHGGHSQKITHTGFRIVLNNVESGKKKTFFPVSQYIHWIAIGW